MEGALRMSNRKIEISPSVLGADLMRLGEEIRMVEALGIHWLHLDNMDGHFAPNISFGPDFVRAIRRQTKLFLDTHLMLSEPMKYIEAYARAGADLITVHAEADDNYDRFVDSKVFTNKIKTSFTWFLWSTSSDNYKVSIRTVFIFSCIDFFW